MQNYHIIFTDFASEYWNKEYKDFGGKDIMRFLNVLYDHQALINSYGMTDPRYINSYNEVCGTFCVRTFNNTMPMVLEVLEKMQKDFYKEKETICVSYGPTDLFRFVNEVFDCYEFCPQVDVCKSLLSLIFKIISSFQKEFRLVVSEAQDMGMEVFCALTNSNVKFMGAVRQFMERVNDSSGLEIQEIQKVRALFDPR